MTSGSNLKTSVAAKKLMDEEQTVKKSDSIVDRYEQIRCLNRLWVVPAILEILLPIGCFVAMCLHEEMREAKAPLLQLWLQVDFIMTLLTWPTQYMLELIRERHNI